MKYVLTGSRGFVGTHLRRLFEQRGDEIIEIDRIEPVNLDLLTLPQPELYKLLAGADGVFHLAANADWRACEANPQLAWDNVAMTYPVLEAAASLNIPVVQASSAMVYGTPNDSPVLEDVVWQNPESVYGISKQACESIARMFWARHSARQASARFWNIYGPGQDQAVTYQSAFIPNIIRLFSKTQDAHGNLVKMRSAPWLTRDWVHVEDIAAALVAIMAVAQDKSRILFPAYNVAGGQAMQLMDTVHMLCDLLGYHPAIEWGNDGSVEAGGNDPGRIQQTPYRANVSALKDLDWAPKWGLREGLAKTCESMGVCPK